MCLCVCAGIVWWQCLFKDRPGSLKAGHGTETPQTSLPEVSLSLCVCECACTCLRMCVCAYMCVCLCL